MILLKDTTCTNTSDFLSKAIRTAEYYGFAPLESFPKERARLAPRKEKDESMTIVRRDERTLLVSAKHSVSCARRPGEALLMWRLNTNGGKDRTGLPIQGLELHIVGAPHAIAEMLLIVVADAIAAETGVRRRVLSINSIGSMESSNRFIRDVTAFLRKHIETIAPALRPRAATDPLGTLVQLFERGHPATSRAPQSVEYLTEEERRRFWDLLEHLEVFGLPYELSPSVLGSRDFWAHTLFEIAAIDTETNTRVPFASGGRYDPLASRLSVEATPAVVVSITCESRGKTHVRPQPTPSPSIYFAHLGPEARRRSLSVLEMLRAAGILVRQSIMHERLGDQMEHAKRSNISHLLIMGHKEAMEKTILVREVATNSQEAVPLDELPGYLRRYKKIEAARV